MAVDANVLVFERMREEKERGASWPSRSATVSTGPG
jgi:preprotein translocase subunit SecD